MRTRRIWSCVAVGALVAMGVAAPMPVSSAETLPGVTEVRVDPGPFPVDGLTATKDIGIRVHVVEPRGLGAGRCYLPEYDFLGADSVQVTLTRTAGGPDEKRWVHLHLTAGTGRDGTWEGTWHVGATLGGTWTVTGVWWCYYSSASDYGGMSVDLRDSRVGVQIVATHVPTVTMVRIPAISAYGARQWARYTYRDGDGHPLAHRTITYGEDTDCGFYGNGTRRLTTDSLGRITVRLSRDYMQCVYFTVPTLGPGHRIDDVTVLSKLWLSRYEHFGTVGVRAPATRVKVGAPLAVTGTAWPRWGALRLMQLVGRTWRTLAVKPISRATGKATFAWHGTRAGPVTLRVVASGSTWSSLAPTPSRNLRIVVVR